jgi:hypothetical protein
MTPSSLNRPPEMGHNAKPVPTLTRDCLECGDAFQTPARTPGLFCSVTHKRDFQNRRQQRGAQLYDLLMVTRYDHEAVAKMKAQGISLFTLLYRMAADFRDEDHEKRKGRRSWRNPVDVVDDHPNLFARRVNVRRRPK